MNRVLTAYTFWTTVWTPNPSHIHRFRQRYTHDAKQRVLLSHNSE